MFRKSILTEIHTIKRETTMTITSASVSNRANSFGGVSEIDNGWSSRTRTPKIRFATSASSMVLQNALPSCAKTRPF